MTKGRKSTFNEDDRASLLAFYRAQAGQPGPERERWLRLANQLAAMQWYEIPYRMIQWGKPVRKGRT